VFHKEGCVAYPSKFTQSKQITSTFASKKGGAGVVPGLLCFRGIQHMMISFYSHLTNWKCVFKRFL